MKTAPLILPLALCFLSAPARAEKPAELNKMRFEFEVELAELIKPLQGLSTKYREHLEKQKTAFQQAGNLEAVLAVDAELKIFEADLTKEFSPVPELKRLQGIYREQRKGLEQKLNQKKLALYRSYEKKVKDLSSRLTKEGKIEEAKLALEESKRIGAMVSSSSAMATIPTIAELSAPVTDSGADNREAGEEMKNSLRMKLCWIPAGKFTMGSPEGEVGRIVLREDQVEVKLTRGFWIGKYEVTQDEYEEVIGSNPAKFKGVGKRASVEMVSWNDAMAFCKALTERERHRESLLEGWVYTLPTEAQWEYACRAGEAGPYSGGELDEVGWYTENSGRSPHEVGEKKANKWGLHDMHGNVREWCLDWVSAQLTGGKDPTGPASGSERMRRGGSWDISFDDCRAARRRGSTPDTRASTVGFRVCLISEP